MKNIVIFYWIPGDNKFIEGKYYYQDFTPKGKGRLKRIDDYEAVIAKLRNDKKIMKCIGKRDTKYNYRLHYNFEYI